MFEDPLASDPLEQRARAAHENAAKMLKMTNLPDRGMKFRAAHIRTDTDEDDEEKVETGATLTRAEEIIKMFQEQVFTKRATQEKRQYRATKIICTLGENTMNVESIKKMISNGMDVIRICKDYLDGHAL